MSNKRRQVELKPFHESIVDEMKGINPTVKHAAQYATRAAYAIRRTKCPKNRDVVRQALGSMLARLGSIRHKRFTTADRSELLGAFDALRAQDEAAHQAGGETDEDEGAG